MCWLPYYFTRVSSFMKSLKWLRPWLNIHRSHYILSLYQFLHFVAVMKTPVFCVYIISLIISYVEVFSWHNCRRIDIPIDVGGFNYKIRKNAGLDHKHHTFVLGSQNMSWTFGCKFGKDTCFVLLIPVSKGWT